jgi:hypothetical protein
LVRRDSLVRRIGFTLPLLAVWLALVGAGMAWLAAYANEPGPEGKPPAVWPSASTIARADRTPTLLVFAHPYCGCSRASVSELARAMSKLHGRVDTRVVMYRPDDQTPEWAHTASWDAAAAIPGVRMIVDAGGRESRRFGAAVSGHTLLYDARGRLAFSGGITASRGHEGDNAGREALTDLVLAGSTNGPTTTPVFGCFLRHGAESE